MGLSGTCRAFPIHPPLSRQRDVLQTSQPPRFLPVPAKMHLRGRGVSIGCLCYRDCSQALTPQPLNPSLAVLQLSSLQLLQSLPTPGTEHFLIPLYLRGLPARTKSPSGYTYTCSGQSCCSLQPTVPLQTCQQSSFPASFGFSVMQVFCLASSHLFALPYSEPHASLQTIPLLPCLPAPKVLPHKCPSCFSSPIYPFPTHYKV